MWRAVRRVPEFLRASDEQMRRDQDLIRRKNLGTLKSVCLVYTLLLLAYSVTAFFLFCLLYTSLHRRGRQHGAGAAIRPLP